MCKYFMNEISLGFWCNKQFDTDFMRAIDNDEREIIYNCHCNECPFIEKTLIKWEGFEI